MNEGRKPEDIKMDNQSLGHYNIDSIHVSHDKGRWRDLVQTASNGLENWNTVDGGGKRHERWL